MFIYSPVGCTKSNCTLPHESNMVIKMTVLSGQKLVLFMRLLIYRYCQEGLLACRKVEKLFL